MRLAVLGSADNWYFADLRRAAGKRHELTAIGFTQLLSAVTNTTVIRGGGLDLSEFDAVLIRAMPAGSLEQIVFRMDALANLAATGVRIINSPRAIEVAVDKYLATSRLAAAGLLVPQTVTCQTVDEALAAFDQLKRDVVVKPLFGSEGRGIVRLTDIETAYRTFRALAQLGSVLYLQEYVPHEGADLRLLVIGDQVIGMRRTNSLDWRTNIRRGAVGEPLEVSAYYAETAKIAAQAIGASCAGVDLLPGKDGRLYAIEVNAVPGWKELSAVTNVDVAARVLEFLAES